jgi:hypothetical protein
LKKSLFFQIDGSIEKHKKIGRFKDHTGWRYLIGSKEREEQTNSVFEQYKGTGARGVSEGILSWF